MLAERQPTWLWAGMLANLRCKRYVRGIQGQFNHMVTWAWMGGGGWHKVRWRGPTSEECKKLTSPFMSCIKLMFKAVHTTHSSTQNSFSAFTAGFSVFLFLFQLIPVCFIAPSYTFFLYFQLECRLIHLSIRHCSFRQFSTFFRPFSLFFHLAIIVM